MKLQIILNGVPLVDVDGENGARGNVDPIPALAEFFAGLDDDSQARFFELAANALARNGGMAVEAQALYIGEHLATCSCISELGRGFVEAIVYGMKRAGGGHS